MRAEIAAAALVIAAAAVLLLPRRRRARFARVMARKPLAAAPSVRAVVTGKSGPVALLALVGIGSGLAGGPVAAFAAVAYAWLGVRALRLRWQRRTDARLHGLALDALSGLSDDVRAGCPPTDALASAVQGIAREAGPDIAAQLWAVEASADDAAVAAALRAIDHPALRDATSTAAAVWSLSASGIPLACLVERMGSELRARQTAALRADAQLAGVRATTALLGALPAFGVLIGFLLGAHPLEVLLTSALGGACAVCAVVLQVAGAVWSGRLAAAGAV